MSGDGLALLRNVEVDPAVGGEAGAVARALGGLARSQLDLTMVDLTLPAGICNVLDLRDSNELVRDAVKWTEKR